MDLYKPMLSGLKFFWDNMVSGGVILLQQDLIDRYETAKKKFLSFGEKKKKLRKDGMISDESFMRWIMSDVNKRIKLEREIVDDD